jgi:hypothetical protein
MLNVELVIVGGIRNKRADKEKAKMNTTWTQRYEGTRLQARALSGKEILAY